MKDKRFRFGVIVSVVWVGVAVYFLFTKSHPTELNAWGDFIAGFSAPLAFLWLVLGYMQQGDELRHSTEALRLQAEELKNSVEQQSQLVAVSREQMQMEMQVIEEERNRIRENGRPRFVARRSTSIFDGMHQHHTLEIINVGNIAGDVTFEVLPHDSNRPQRFGAFGRDAKYVNTIQYVTDADYQVRISYTDANGTYGVSQIDFQMSRQDLTTEPARRLI